MSGICGVFRRNGQPEGVQLVQSMLDRLSHRGPDGEGVWHDGPVALGHCMLHVTPESLQEHLPSLRDEIAITSDARIDNREELIAILRTDLRDQAPSDSDLIAAAYQKWGEECVSRLAGDFAFAIWDTRRQRLFCACDPMGVKSLYYHITHKAIFFASEVKALVHLPEVPRQLNELRVAEYLIMLFEDRTGTFYEGILRLPGGHTMTVTRDKLCVGRYWQLDSSRELRLKSDREYEEAFREKFTQAVRCRTRSAFPIGCALSGGLDSSSVACVARNLRAPGSSPLSTFSLIFPDLPQEDRSKIDERPEMNAVLQSGGFDPHFVRADLLSPMRDVERMHFHLDHANCAPNLYLHWAMYGAAKAKGVRVFLDGFDGDSAVSHGFERLTELASTLRWRTLWRETTLLTANHLAGVHPWRILRKYCVKPFAPRWVHSARQMLQGRYREAFSQNILISDELKRRTRIEQRAHDLLRDQTAWSLKRSAREYHLSSIGQALYSYTLEIADKATAAFGIEGRYPFFDRRLLEFCLSLPAEQKLAQGWNRWILRRSMAGIIPPEIQWRPRKGNLSPNFHRRLLDFEREKLEQVTLGGAAELAPFVDPGAMKAAYREYQKNYVRSQGESFHLFAAVNLALWLRSAGFGS
ncbi:MAG TPA: lasso peptide isopeptide bond-forming cyclase [Bryobacteraceae bacterium]|nr:lasso peptide isopeptide bond-forming cyclase [Bryobacteraceae bacterium]